MGVLVAVLAQVAFHEDLFRDLFDLFKYAIGGGAVRAATNDGLPNAVRMYKGQDAINLDGTPVQQQPPLPPSNQVSPPL